MYIIKIKYILSGYTVTLYYNVRYANVHSPAWLEMTNPKY
jgi:hypothetical protein